MLSPAFCLHISHPARRPQRTLACWSRLVLQAAGYVKHCGFLCRILICQTSKSLLTSDPGGNLLCFFACLSLPAAMRITFTRLLLASSYKNACPCKTGPCHSKCQDKQLVQSVRSDQLTASAAQLFNASLRSAHLLSPSAPARCRKTDVRVNICLVSIRCTSSQAGYDTAMEVMQCLTAKHCMKACISSIHSRVFLPLLLTFRGTGPVPIT